MRSSVIRKRNTVGSERRILRNTLLLSAGEALGQLANLIFVASFAHAFGTAALGHYAAGMAVGALAAPLVALGTQSFLVRELSRNPQLAAERIGVLAPVQLLLAIGVWLVASAIGSLLSSGAPLGIMLGVCAYQILWRASGLFYVPFVAAERMGLPAAAEFGHRLLVLAVGLAAILLGASAPVTLLALPLSALAFAAFGWRRVARDFATPALRFAPAQAFELFRAAAPFFGVILLSVLYVRGGIVMLSTLRDAAEVGLYTAADRVLIAATLLPSMLSAAVYPTLSRLYQSSPDQAQRLARRCVALLFVGGIPLAAGLSFFATDIVRLIFGPQYAATVPALQLLAWVVPVFGVRLVLGAQLAAMNRQKEMAPARLLGLTAFVCTSYLLIERAGMIGLACAVLICETFQALVYAVLARSRTH